MSETAIRTQLVNLLTKQQAHMNLDDALKNFPAKDYNTRPPNVEYTFWHLLEHSHQPVGYSGLLPQSRLQVCRMAARLLACQRCHH